MGYHNEEIAGIGPKRFGRHIIKFACKACGRKGEAQVDPSRDIGWYFSKAKPRRTSRRTSSRRRSTEANGVRKRLSKAARSSKRTSARKRARRKSDAYFAFTQWANRDIDPRSY
jgi:hypothetical protein